MKILSKITGEEAMSTHWNLSAAAEIVVGFSGERGMDSCYAKDWVCACHSLPLREDPDGRGIVMCKLEADKALWEAIR